MNDSLINMIAIGILLAIIFIFVILPQLRVKSNEPVLPKLRHKILAVITCVLFLIMGFFLGKHHSEDYSPYEYIFGNEEETDEASSKEEMEPPFLYEYLEEMEMYINLEHYDSAAQYMADLKEIKHDDSQNDINPLGIQMPSFFLGDDHPERTRIEEIKAFLMSAYVFGKLEKWSSAIDSYNTAMELAKPKHHIFFLQHRAAMYRDSGAYRTALMEYQAIIKENQKLPHPFVDIVDVYYGQGMAYEGLEQLDKAKEAYRKAQELAYEYTPCACYESENNNIDPMACKFTWIGENRYEYLDLDNLTEQQLASLGYVSPPKPLKRPLTDEEIENLIGSEKYRNYEDVSTDIFLTELTPEQEKLIQEVEALRNPGSQDYEAEIRQWKQSEKLRKEKFILEKKEQQRQTLELRTFTPNTALAYVYYRNGRLQLKEGDGEAAAASFIKLMEICGNKKNGACAELIELMGEDKFEAILDIMAISPTDAQSKVSEILKRVRVRDELQNILLKNWKLIALIGLLGLCTFFVSLHFIRLKKVS